MKIYTIENTSYDGGTEYFATAVEALKRARELKRNGQETVEIELHEVVRLDKSALIDILASNGGQWSMSSEIIKVL